MFLLTSLSPAPPPPSRPAVLPQLLVFLRPRPILNIVTKMTGRDGRCVRSVQWPQSRPRGHFNCSFCKISGNPLKGRQMLGNQKCNPKLTPQKSQLLCHLILLPIPCPHCNILSGLANTGVLLHITFGVASSKHWTKIISGT